MCHNGISSLLSRKTTKKKKGSNFSHAHSHLFTVQSSHQESLAGLWPALAHFLTTKRFTGHGSIILVA